jgi:hypothetical protein
MNYLNMVCIHVGQAVLSNDVILGLVLFAFSSRLVNVSLEVALADVQFDMSFITMFLAVCLKLATTLKICWPIFESK